MAKGAVKVEYRAEIGSVTAASDARASDRQLLSLVVELGMDGSGGRVDAELAGADFDPPAPGDAVSVKLGIGAGLVPVFKGEAAAVEVGPASQRVLAQDALGLLGGAEAEGAYQDVNADFIVKDLLDQAGCKAGGAYDAGPKFAFFVAHRGRALRHLQRLAELCGADLYTDGQGKLHFALADTTGASHSFQFGENLLAVNLRKVPPLWDSMEVWGEGAAGAKGADKAHWLCTDLSGVSAKAAVDDDGKVSTGKLGKRPQRLVDGALRSGEAAAAVAKGRMAWIATRWVQGDVEVTGAPAVMPGDTVKLEKLPASHAAAKLLGGGRKLRVRGVRHSLDRERGLTTRLEF
ncbi:MAG: hypothetical protein JNJ60_00855 [Rhodocyclaceae bacterium]|nr:hypothetical protein [Rhodocyclaceae bacterium]